MKILLYGINYSPELTGIGKYTGEMAVWLAAHGHEVRVITAPPYYPAWKVEADYCSWRYFVEQRDGVGVWRAPLWVPFRPNALKRLLHLASFAVTSIPLLLRHLFWRPNVVWVVAPALFCVPGALLTARLTGSRSWLHIQDFEVDAAFELGMLKGVRLRTFALGIESWLMRNFDRVSSISHRMIEHLRQKGVAEEKIFWLPNWVNIAAIRTVDVTGDVGRTGLLTEKCYRTDLQISRNAIVALYSGNMGDKQGLEILSQVIALTMGRNDLVWVFCGDGIGRANLERGCMGFTNVRFLPLQPAERFNELLNMADIHLLPQRADVADLVMPSKLTGMLASGRPVVASALPGTQVATVCEQCGLVVPPGDAEAFAEAVLSLADDALFRLDLGLKARSYAEFHFEHDAILSRFEAELQSLIESPRGNPPGN